MGPGSHTTPADGCFCWESIVVRKWTKMPKIAAINAAISRCDVERAPRRINLQTVICTLDVCQTSGIPDKTLETPLLFTHLAARQITKSSSHWSRSKKPWSSHLRQAFRTPAGMKKDNKIRETERRGGENVIDWLRRGFRLSGCTQLITSSDLLNTLPSFIPPISLTPSLPPLASPSSLLTAKHFLSLFVSLSPAVQTSYLVLSFWNKEDGRGVSVKYPSGIWYLSSHFMLQFPCKIFWFFYPDIIFVLLFFTPLHSKQLKKWPNL